MKSRAIACLALLFCMVSTAAESRDQRSAPRGETVKGLQVNLSADRSVCPPGTEITLAVEFVNRSTHPLRILRNDIFIGDELVVNRRAKAPVPPRSGFIWYSPKVNRFPGRSLVLMPKDRKTLFLKAYLDRRYRLVFAGKDDWENRQDRKAVKKRLGLPLEYPDQYVARGRIFHLGGPGRYEIRFVYARTEADRYWRFPATLREEERSLDRLWLGKTASNTIVVEVSP